MKLQGEDQEREGIERVLKRIGVVLHPVSSLLGVVKALSRDDKKGKVKSNKGNMLNWGRKCLWIKGRK